MDLMEGVIFEEAYRHPRRPMQSITKAFNAKTLTGIARAIYGVQLDLTSRARLLPYSIHIAKKPQLDQTSSRELFSKPASEAPITPSSNFASVVRVKTVVWSSRTVHSGLLAAGGVWIEVG